MPKGKGWSIAGTYTKQENAMKRAKVLEPKFFEVQVKKGIHSWGGGVGVVPKKQNVYRVWVK